MHLIFRITVRFHNKEKYRTMATKSKTYIDQKGYRRFRGSHTPVHRWVAEKKIGRKLNSQEVVHHINRDKLNNKPSNLHVFKNQAAHESAHKRDAKKYGGEQVTTASIQQFKSI
jgi:hypothetical protein